MIFDSGHSGVHSPNSPTIRGDSRRSVLPLVPFIGWFRHRQVTQGNCSNEMHSTCAVRYAFRLTLNQAASPALYRARSFDRGTARSAIFLAAVGLSMSMFSLVQMQLSHHAPMRRLQKP
ncbi:uncharacterized protein LOC105829670 [Monomorium pharaonis]|uniref:uncharacterized protein LOC105829670 n=1 Tax=Monomorium pharaonis TaxID=307658 RepID=UPI00102E1D29|nr:uncharacterized protein LOC105829670 [Monomorium pharaonis]